MSSYSLLNFVRFNKEKPRKFAISKSLSIPGYKAQGTKCSSSNKTAAGIIHGTIKHLFSEIQVKKRGIRKVTRQLSVRKGLV